MTTLTLKGTHRRKKVYVVNNAPTSQDGGEGRMRSDCNQIDRDSSDGVGQRFTNAYVSASADPEPKPKRRKKKKTKAKTPPPPPKPKKIKIPMPTKKKVRAWEPQILRGKYLDRLMRLHEALPELINFSDPKPLAIGISEKLLADESVQLPRKVIEKGIRCYVKLPQYQAAMIAGRVRVNADGSEDVVPSESEVKHARKELESFNAMKIRWPEAYVKACSDYPQIFQQGT